jgi:hypothetical protein
MLVPRPVAQSEQLFNHDLFNRVDLNSRPFRQIVETVISALYGTVLQENFVNRDVAWWKGI